MSTLKEVNGQSSIKVLGKDEELQLLTNSEMLKLGFCFLLRLFDVDMLVFKDKEALKLV